MIYAIFKATIIDPGSIAAYRESAAAALAKHGGKVEQATPAPTALDGTPQIPDIAAILSFPNADAARAWINDPELASIHDLRRKAGDTEIMLLG